MVTFGKSCRLDGGDPGFFGGHLAKQGQGPVSWGWIWFVTGTEEGLRAAEELLVVF